MPRSKNTTGEGCFTASRYCFTLPSSSSSLNRNGLLKNNWSIPSCCALRVISRDTSSKHTYPRFFNAWIQDDFQVPGPPVITIIFFFKAVDLECKNRYLKLN